MALSGDDLGDRFLGAVKMVWGVANPKRWIPGYQSLEKNITIPSRVDIRADLQKQLKKDIPQSIQEKFGMLDYVEAERLDLYNWAVKTNELINVQIYEKGKIEPYMWGVKYLCLAVKWGNKPMEFKKDDEIVFVSSALEQASQLNLDLIALLSTSEEEIITAAGISPRLALVAYVMANIAYAKSIHLRSRLIQVCAEHANVIHSAEDLEAESLRFQVAITILLDKKESGIKREKQEGVENWKAKMNRTLAASGFSTVAGATCNILSDLSMTKEAKVEQLRKQFEEINKMSAELIQEKMKEILHLFCDIDLYMNAGGVINTRLCSLLFARLKEIPDKGKAGPNLFSRLGEAVRLVQP